MRNIYYILLIILSAPYFVSAQINLVPNPSFENYTSCPQFPPDESINNASSWFQPRTDENSFKGNFNIYSYDSKLIATFKLSSYNTNLDISELVNGLYIVEINSEAMQFERKKLIVIK